MATPISRKEQKELTRRGLIAAAADLFAKNGISATATAEVAKALNVSHGTVFIHFPTREDLIIAVLDEVGSRLSDEIGKSIGNELNLRGILEAHLAVLSEFEDFYFRLVTEIHTLPAQVKSLLFMLNAAVSCKIYEAARSQIKAKKIRPFERHMLFNTWIALVDYHVTHRDLFTKKKSVLTEKGDELVSHFLSLIQT